MCYSNTLPTDRLEQPAMAGITGLVFKEKKNPKIHMSPQKNISQSYNNLNNME